MKKKILVMGSSLAIGTVKLAPLMPDEVKKVVI